ncbi:MAG: PSD1 and planctomycete cytochrome C domain-containing protein [Planctomycetota bacterium]|nr:PSD1 and planctomycete cytochrome C domain-containing protein [Planctomycetota bacterium]
MALQPNSLWPTVTAMCLLQFTAFAGCRRAEREETAQPKPLRSRTVSYREHIAPILQAHCVDCHGPDRQEKGLRLDTLDGIFRGSDQGAVIVGGSSKDSPLLRMISGEEPAMPSDSEPLVPHDLELIAKWIDSEAVFLEASHAQVPERPASDHWAFQPIQPRPIHDLPHSDWHRNPVDVFVHSRLLQEDLRPSGPAALETLARRVSLDITGLPPTIEEVDAFVNDSAPAAYERLVDRLLASPQFGEHWGRYWLDLARYADSNGYHRDTRRPMWRYRDWVIRAFNEDMPFDQFTIEQLAGDLLPEPTTEQLIATGFHRNTMFNQEGGIDPEEFRVKAVDDRVETTGLVWLGLTVGCARCHDHPYDDVLQEDFYRLYAFFNDTADGGGTKDELPGPLLVVGDQRLKGELDRLSEQTTARRQELVKNRADTEMDSTLMDLLVQRDELANAFGVMIMRRWEQPRATFVHLRGDFQRRGKRVFPGVPSELPQPPGGYARDRLDLAKWLVGESNPLTARVTVNRIWEKIFGRGIVRTTEDFGTQGELPEHPELLDDLAHSFVASGWDVKEILKMIVTSATYRQSPFASPTLLERDPDNRLLSRGPRFRLEAECLRDVALATSGLLDQTIGGRPVYPPQPTGIYEEYVEVNFGNPELWRTSQSGDRYRRGIYTYWRRSMPYPSFVVFDAPSREHCQTRRARSNTPLQALTTLNDPAFVECAIALAKRIRAHGDTNEQRISYGFRLCTGRRPMEEELRILEELFVSEAEGSSPAGVDRAWQVIANTILNLDATLTKS